MLSRALSLSVSLPFKDDAIQEKILQNRRSLERLTSPPGAASESFSAQYVFVYSLTLNRYATTERALS